MPHENSVLSWIHFGDLHITEPGLPNHSDFQALVALANRRFAGGVDFAVLPGDNADDGTEAQFRLVRDAADALEIPLHILPGDHDFHTRSLDAYYGVLGGRHLPYAETVNDCRCLFLDIVSAGTGGPDFRVDDAQLDWMELELIDAVRQGLSSAVFMHAYPADLRAGGERLQALLARHGVASVDMGHTHYNELANDGRTVFMATRSTGQIEEGPVGFSVAAIDGGAVSWRFVELAAVGPTVLITRPADARLAADEADFGQRIVRAKIWGDGVRQVAARLGQADPVPLVRDAADVTLWSAPYPTAAPDGEATLTVTAEAADGVFATDTITVAGTTRRAARRHRDGSDRDAVGAWPERGILGTQLGPNRNGRKW